MTTQNSAPENIPLSANKDSSRTEAVVSSRPAGAEPAQPELSQELQAVTLGRSIAELSQEEARLKDSIKNIRRQIETEELRLTALQLSSKAWLEQARSERAALLAEIEALHSRLAATPPSPAPSATVAAPEAGPVANPSDIIAGSSWPEAETAAGVRNPVVGRPVAPGNLRAEQRVRQILRKRLVSQASNPSNPASEAFPADFNNIPAPLPAPAGWAGPDGDPGAAWLPEPDVFSSLEDGGPQTLEELLAAGEQEIAAIENEASNTPPDEAAPLIGGLGPDNAVQLPTERLARYEQLDEEGWRSPTRSWTRAIQPDSISEPSSAAAGPAITTRLVIEGLAADFSAAELTQMLGSLAGVLEVKPLDFENERLVLEARHIPEVNPAGRLLELPGIRLAIVRRTAGLVELRRTT